MSVQQIRLTDLPHAADDRKLPRIEPASARLKIYHFLSVWLTSWRWSDWEYYTSRHPQERGLPGLAWSFPSSQVNQVNSPLHSADDSGEKDEGISNSIIKPWEHKQHSNTLQSWGSEEHTPPSSSSSQQVSRGARPPRDNDGERTQGQGCGGEAEQ